MKTVKLLLYAVVILSVIGAAVAFKVGKTEGDLYQCDYKTNLCYFVDINYRLTSSGGIVLSYATITYDNIEGFPCNPFCDDQIRVKPE